MRLLCDEMLARLCRWLRAAGYDAALAESGAIDRQIIRRAVTEDRLLLTRDRGFLERREARRVVWLEANDLEAQVAELGARLDIDWLCRPFSRCLVCNVPLEPATEPPPPGAEGPTWRCPDCRRLYWDGSHVRRMRARLAAWQAGHASG